MLAKNHICQPTNRLSCCNHGTATANQRCVSNKPSTQQRFNALTGNNSTLPRVTTRATFAIEAQLTTPTLVPDCSVDNGGRGGRYLRNRGD